MLCFVYQEQKTNYLQNHCITKLGEENIGITDTSMVSQKAFSLTGIGSGRSTLEQCIELASRPQVTQQWKKCNHLIIDEISMVDGEFFDKLETIAR